MGWPGGPPHPPRPHAPSWYEQAKSWYVLTPVLSGGLGAPALPVWALVRAIRGKTDRDLQSSASQARLIGHAALFGLVVALSILLTALAPHDSSGTATGPAADAAGIAVLVNLVVGVGYALRLRSKVFPSDPPVAPADLEALPGVQQARARRDLRERYRQLAASDPVIAADIGVGRPDRPRQFDDGGLVDVNAVDGALLVRHLGVSPSDAEQILAVRRRFGRLSNADELLVHTQLSEPVVQRVREYGLFAH